MGDVIDISPSPELKPRTGYRPLRRKRDTDGNESVIELSDSTDSQSSTQCKRVKRRKEAAESRAGPSTAVVRSRASSLRATRRPHKLKGQTPASRHASAAPQRATSPVQKPHAHAALLEQEPEVQPETKPLTPSAAAATGTPQLPDRQTPPPEHDPLPHESPPPASADASDVAPEPYERLVERVHEVVPDVLPAHVFDLLAAHDTGVNNRDNLLNLVIHILLEDRSYPKDIKGKGKARAAAEETSGDTNTSVDYTHPPDRRLGRAYRNLSLKYLRSNFRDLDASFISETFSSHENHYAPAYLFLLQLGASPISVLPVAPNPGKGKAKARNKSSHDEEEFMKEHTWLVQKLETRQGSPVPDLTSEHLEEGEGVECGCCFTTYPFSEMAQCTDTHLFCKGCVTSYTSTKLGEQNAELHCMDISGCKMGFPESELRRILPTKLFDLYEQIRQRRDIELAELEGLEECPFCDYKVVLDVDFETDKVLTCQNEACLKVSCRKCKKEDHLPKSCEEMEEDKMLDGKHAIEEAMTRALMRNCPKCQKAFVKEYGCNKMICTYCSAMSCYVCRSVIHGYEHFDQSRPRDAQPASSSSKKCPLWDSAGDRHAKEVAAAADKALKEYKTLHPDVQDEDIRHVGFHLHPLMFKSITLIMRTCQLLILLWHFLCLRYLRNDNN
ncbi:hypothetical protein F5888DRAFT_1685256 [Russula emetica]|nr:hypothetical protein F5888DRAFT_1685256 [Russula emetica]